MDPVTENPSPAPEAPAPEKKEKGRLEQFAEQARDLVIVLLAVLVVRATVVSPFQISGGSMNDSYADGELIALDHFSYFRADNFAKELKRGDIGALREITSTLLRWTVGLTNFKVGDPARGDVVVFRPHAGNGKDYYIKRVIGLPGDGVKVGGGYVWLKPGNAGEWRKLDEKYLSAANLGSTAMPGADAEFLVPADKYFLLGDNRLFSSDSRTCFRTTFGGCPDDAARYIDRSDILGKVWLSLGTLRLSSPVALFRNPRWTDTPRTWNYPELSATGAAK